LRDSFALVPQDPALFNISLYENIRMLVSRLRKRIFRMLAALQRFTTRLTAFLISTRPLLAKEA